MEPVSPELDNDTPATTSGPSGHPLFPRAEHETGPDMRRIDLIHIERLKEDGTWEACPRVFKAHELQSWKDIVEQFGGGVYRARAQCKKTYQWQGMTERKEFNGSPSRPFCEEPPKPKTPPAPPAETAQPAPQAPAASFGVPFASAGWTPPQGWTPPGWTPPQSTQAPQEPPFWVAMMLKMLDRQQAPSAGGDSLLAVFFKAQADRDAVMLKVQAERDAMLFKLLADRSAPGTASTASPLEMLREIKPLLHNTTAPGQFMQGIEVAKSLMQQSAPAAPQEDFTTTVANLMRTLSPQGIPGFGGSPVPAPPVTTSAAPPVPAAPPAPTLNFDDVIRMIARDRNMALRFIAEMRRSLPANDLTPPVPHTAPTSTSVSAPVPTVAPSQTQATNTAPVAAETTSPFVSVPSAPVANATPTRPTSTTVAPSTTTAAIPGMPGATGVASASAASTNGPESTIRPVSAFAGRKEPVSVAAEQSSSTPTANPEGATADQLDTTQARPGDYGALASGGLTAMLEGVEFPDIPGLRDAITAALGPAHPALLVFTGKGAAPDMGASLDANGPPTTDPNKGEGSTS